MNAPVITCPCCGQPVPAGQFQAAMAAAQNLTPLGRKIVECLASAAGAWVPRRALEDFIYADRIDGGPEDPISVIKVVVCKMKPTLRAAGYAIEARHGGRGETSSWRRLVRVAA